METTYSHLCGAADSRTLHHDVIVAAVTSCTAHKLPAATSIYPTNGIPLFHTYTSLITSHSPTCNMRWPLQRGVGAAGPAAAVQHRGCRPCCASGPAQGRGATQQQLTATPATQHTHRQNSLSCARCLSLDPFLHALNAHVSTHSTNVWIEPAECILQMQAAGKVACQQVQFCNPSTVALAPSHLLIIQQ